MRKLKLMASICPHCLREMTYRAGYLFCPLCNYDLDLVRESERKTCSCLCPQIRFISSRDVCTVCGGKVVRKIARKPTKKQLAAYLEF